MFDQQDLIQFEKKGIDPLTIRKQLNHFSSGFPYVRLDRPAREGDGIVRFKEDEVSYFQAFFEKEIQPLKVVKFVPASGAASRMFKHLFEFRDRYTPDAAGPDLFLKDQGFNSVYYFISHITDLAFYDDLCILADRSGSSLKKLLASRDFGPVIDLILSPDGLNYAQLPKALIKFHRYPDGARTAAEEHLAESAVYAADCNRKARIHFTISPEHKQKFLSLLDQVQGRFESETGVILDASFSVQKPSTDTIAVDENNKPWRNADGTILFRPGGHGALLENLNDIDADLIFIKNIDNVVPDHLKGPTYQYKKLLGGYLLHLKDRIHGFLERLTGNNTTEEEMKQMTGFAREQLFMDLPADFGAKPLQEQAMWLRKGFDRPVRVCGMVKNEGEPGGGPFWVKGDDGTSSLQIVETSQIDFADPVQKKIAAESTHFNPVDLVCCTRSFTGERFDLKKFVDENTGFISLKSSGGNILKAQELPGLWNGSMADWITIFVEVPIITFNPVKTVNDLLRKEHLSE